MGQIVSTTAGPVEIRRIEGEHPPVLFFPGGHCSADCDCGWGVYTEGHHAVIAFSRPGYGRTRVGRMTALEFTPVVREVCDRLGVSAIAGVVGVSFGGLQAAHVAGPAGTGGPRLVLHSCAPARSPYPQPFVERIGGRIIFSTVVQRPVWAFARQLVRSDWGLRRLMARLSALPVAAWWDQLTADDKDDARALFGAMRSGGGFVNDLRQSRAAGSRTRAEVFSTVACPTLVTGSPHDAGVPFAYARELADIIPGAVLVELDSPSHLFWIGPGKAELASVVRAFLDG